MSETTAVIGIFVALVFVLTVAMFAYRAMRGDRE